MKLGTKIIIITVILGLTAGAGFLSWKFSQKESLSLKESPQTERTAEEKKEAETPPSFHIGEVPYYSEITGPTEGFCYGYSSMMLLEHYGFSKKEVRDFRDFVREKGRGGPPDVFVGFEKLGLMNKVHLGYSQNYNQDFAAFYKSFVGEEDEQITIFENQEAAVAKLKQLISSGTPVMVIINYGTDYDVAIGYDENHVYLNDPHDKGGPNVKKAWNEFRSEWVISEESTTPGTLGFPGDWGVVWLEK